MAGTKYMYVRKFELPDPVLPSTYIVVRIDGKGFHKFSNKYNFRKPNDDRALGLMNAAASRVMSGNELQGNCVLAFGESDEFRYVPFSHPSFVFKKSCQLYNRRASKLCTLVSSLFTAAYTLLWPQFFSDPLEIDAIPVFDGRLVAYPNDRTLIDYLLWRQADTHINNLYNTVFWALVDKGNYSELDATKYLETTVSSDKNNILFEQFGINYNNEKLMYRKGTLLKWENATDPRTGRATRHVVLAHDDMFKDDFWHSGYGKFVLEN